MVLTQRTAEGESCREWTVDNAYTVCLSLNDHLPRDFKARDGSVFAVSQTGTRKSLSSRPNIEQFVPASLGPTFLITKVMAVLVR
jgi:hypothetical protein